MPDFSDGFLPYLPPDEPRTRTVLRTGLVVVDTNVLLDAYRYTESARNELFAALGALQDRLWIPHQVALEFHRNRAKVIASHGDAYGDALKAIAEVKKQHEDVLKRRIREFTNRVALDEASQEDLLRLAEWDSTRLVERVNGMREAHGVSDRFLREDPVLRKLQTLLAGRVGNPLPPNEESAARQEAADRIQKERPPGFKDSAKEDPCGDYLLWHQSLLEAQQRSAPLMLVTRDGKADWFLEIKGKSLGALPDLVAEAVEVAGVDFVAIPTKSFLLHAKAEFGASISPGTLAQTDAIRQNSAARRRPVLHLTLTGAESLLEHLSTLVETARVDRDALIRDTEDAIVSASAIESLRRLDGIIQRNTELIAKIRDPEHVHDDMIAVDINASERRFIADLEQLNGTRYLHRPPRPGPPRPTESLAGAYLREGAAALDRMSSLEIRRLASVVLPNFDRLNLTLSSTRALLAQRAEGADQLQLPVLADTGELGAANPGRAPTPFEAETMPPDRTPNNR